MNTDIRLSVGFFSHPKTIKLMRQAGAEGVVCLQRLWIWAAQNRVDGCLVGFEADDIEIVAGWTGELGFLVRTLESLRFLDRNDDAYCLHGWAEHQAYVTQEPARIEKSRKAAQKRWNNARRNANDGNGVMPDDASGNASSNARSNASSIARSNAPNQTNPNQEENTSPPVESLVNQDRARSPERGSEGVGADLSGPGLEFVELREFYNREMRAEGPLAGFAEYKQLKAARDMTGASLWPGNARLFDDLAARKEAGVWNRGFEIGLGRYLREKTWLAPIQSRASPPSEATPTEFQRQQQDRRTMMRIAKDLRERERAAKQQAQGGQHGQRAAAATPPAAFD
ncbi:hypothetical protein [Desulfovibrio sp. ZJ369]|uniref:hypothetical protein n=1 Tax=Desulfovibrio sp. ZJ369 TaxID=2709793 RepID=UPI0013EBB697|nr:hypothetical protein [Desulfovibrio sp. ZJ369]